MTPQTPVTSTPLWVVCLCAGWCGVCREYKPLFDSLALKFPHVRFIWLDVEDEAELVDPVEVENFPSILIMSDQTPLFFGPILPHIETLVRLIQEKIIDKDAGCMKDNAVIQLAMRLSQAL